MRRVVAGWALAMVTLVALASVGGAAIAGAPVLLPTLWFASRRTAGWARGGFVVLAALVAVEVAWAAAYVTVGDDDPAIWAAPVAAAAFVGLGLASGRPAGRADMVREAASP